MQVAQQEGVALQIALENERHARMPPVGHVFAVGQDGSVRGMDAATANSKEEALVRNGWAASCRQCGLVGHPAEQDDVAILGARHVLDCPTHIVDVRHAYEPAVVA